MDDYQNEAMPVGAAEVAAATQTLQRYKAGKAALDRRLVDNELWFRMGHWKNYQNPMMPGKAQPSSGWLFNSIANKHADAMDNYPEPNVLPRAADDEATARALSSVLPVVLEQADYEQVYSDCWWRKLISRNENAHHCRILRFCKCLNYIFHDHPRRILPGQRKLPVRKKL